MRYVVILYIPSIDHSSGGVGGYLQVLAHDLGKLVDLHIVSHHSAEELVIDNATVHYIDGRLSRLFIAKRQFCNLLDTIRPDVVHVNSCWEVLCSFTVFWAKSLGYSTVISPHGMLEPWVIKKNYLKKKLPALLLYQKRSLCLADAIIATAKSEKDNLLQLDYNKNVYVVSTGIVVEDIQLKDSWVLNKTILFLALLRPNKGADLLIKAVKALSVELAGFSVVIAGRGEQDYEEYLRRLVADMGLENIVTFPGSVYDENKWRLYREADVFVLPTLNENFGIVVAEALACGTPVITTKGAPWRDLEEWGCGWWIERSVEALVAAMRAFLALTQGERERMGCNGRRLVEAKYSSRQMAANMYKLYGRFAKHGKSQCD